MSRVELSVVVVSFETRELTLRCVDRARAALRAVRERGVPGELIVVDNGSRDGSAEALAAEPEVRLLALPRNRGFAAGANAGLGAAAGRLLALINSDAFLEPEALGRALAHLRDAPWRGIAGVQLRREDGRLQESIHAFPGLRTELVPDRLRRLVGSERLPDRHRRGGAVRDIEAPRGAVLFVHREVVEALGGLDEGYFFFLEETDWCWRARRAGFRVVHLPDVEVTHVSGASSKRRDPVATRIEYHRSLYRFVRLRRGRAEWLAFVAVRQLRSVVALALSLLASPFARGARRALRERAALLAWHLRGQPEGEGLRAGGGGAAPAA